MNRIIVVISPERSGGKQWHGQVKESSVGRRVGHVGREVDGAGVQFGVGGDVSNGGEVVVHQARVVRLVGIGSVEPGLEDEGEEEGAGEGHVVDVEHVGPVGEDRVDVDVLDIWFVGDCILREEEFTDMLKLMRLYQGILSSVSHIP